jgi:hypothetical protein
MKNNLTKLNAWLRCGIFVFLGLWIILAGNPAYAEWNFGIGTGLSRLSINGDLGWETKLAGPVKADVDLSPSDTSDLMESAFGFGGYAANGTWTINYSFLQLKLGDDGKASLPDGSKLKYDMDFEVTSAVMLVTRNIYKSKHLHLGLQGGLRYTKHELTTKLEFGGNKIKNNPDNDWVDAVIGATLTVPITDKWSWNNVANAGYGGSDGTYYGSTGITWRFLKHWSATASGTYTAVDFEEGNKGDSDWYLYDVDETTYGITILFNW